MKAESVCIQCGYRTERLAVTCPRCRQALVNDHCNSCGRCQKRKAGNRKSKSEEGSNE